MCGGEEVLIVGGGNSAGQGAVYLAEHARRVRMLVRGPGLAASMSHYLIERIAASPRIQLQTETEVVALEGGGEEGLRQVRIRHRPSGREEVLAVRHLFLFIGAEPATQWLEGCGVALDEKGFVCTGADVPSGDGARRAPLESSVPGVFAVGDVRAGSVKRVGGAIGEGAAVVAQVHAYLAGAREEAGHRAAGPLRDAPQPAAH